MSVGCVLFVRQIILSEFAIACALKHYIFLSFTVKGVVVGQYAFIWYFQIRHGAGTGLREVLKCHGTGGGKIVGSTAEQVFTSSLDIITVRG